MSENKKDNDSEDDLLEIGQLVRMISGSYGLKEHCLKPENWEKTILPWDNVRIPGDTTGIVVGIMGGWHTIMYTVLWALTSGPKKLIISSNKIEKISDI